VAPESFGPNRDEDLGELIVFAVFSKLLQDQTFSRFFQTFSIFFKTFPDFSKKIEIFQKQIRIFQTFSRFFKNISWYFLGVDEHGVVHINSIAG